MNRYSAALAILLSLSLNAAEIDMQSDDDPNDGPWSVLEAQLDGRVTWLRIRRDIAEADREKMPHQLLVRWKYLDDGDRGMPSVELKDRFHELEETLVTALKADDLAVLALVLTTADAREWHFHFDESEKVQERINAVLIELPNLPISLTGKFDPQWEDYSYFVNALEN